MPGSPSLAEDSAPSPAEAADGADFVFSCVGNDDDLRAVTLGETARFRRLGAARCSSTTPRPRPSIARELHAAAKERGAGSLDAPVSGGQAGAENGTLTVMAGGDAADFDNAKPVIEAYARAVESDRARRALASSPRWSTRSASPA